MTDKKTGKEIIKLGTDEVFALRDKSGEIRAFEHHLTLSVDNGGLIQPGFNKPWVISAQGYEMWAECAGASVIMPRDVVVDGEVRGNPCVTADENNRILSATARAIAFRFSSKGIPQVSDWTTILDLDQYRMLDLLAKAKKHQQAFILLPIEMGKPDKDGTWAKYPFDASTALWVNTTHPEALAWYSQIRQREKKIIDFAQTFAKRNSLKHLSGLQKAPGKEWTIKVLCWRPINNSVIKWDSTQYRLLQERVKDLTDGQDTQVTSGVENAIDDENFEAIEQNTDPEDAPAENGSGRPDQPEPIQDPEPHPPEETVVDNDLEPCENDTENELTEMEIIKNNLIQGKENFPDEFSEACKLSGVNPDKLDKADPKTMNPDRCKKILSDMNSILDQKSI